MEKENLETKFYSLLKETDREGIENIIEWLKSEHAEELPASTKTERHGAYEGGWIKHSYNTYLLFKEKNERFDLGLEEDTLRIVGLLHDACKVGSYIKNSKKAEKQPYKYKTDLHMGHGSKSVYLLMKHGLKLTDDEAMMINWHMGPYGEGWMEFETSTKVKERVRATIALQTADQEASAYLD